MASSFSPNVSSDNVTDSSSFPPLLSNISSTDSGNGRRRSLRRQSMREAARFFRQASSRGMLREPSMAVRETAAEQLEERQNDWAYSKPVVVLDIIWNLGFVVASLVAFILSWHETPSMPLRVWISGYVLQCMMHVLCVCVEYRRRRRGMLFQREGDDFSMANGSDLISSPRGTQYISLAQLDDNGTSSITKHVESANTMFSFIWWIIGFYWVSIGGQALAQDSPLLYWICIIFLAFDVFFVVFCLALACVIGVAVCCCLPCIIAILYAIADQEGATKEDIDELPKYKFEKSVNGGVTLKACSPRGHTLHTDDTECCICLSAYDDGVELRELPCGHHFHCSCVDKWLRINATCPLCKYNILKGKVSPLPEEEEV